MFANGYHQMYDNSNTPSHVKSNSNTMSQKHYLRHKCLNEKLIFLMI